MVQMLPADIRDSRHRRRRRRPCRPQELGPRRAAVGRQHAVEARLAAERALAPGSDPAAAASTSRRPARTRSCRPASGRRWACSRASGQLFGSAEASIVVPNGHGGPAFIAYPNFDVYFEWNQSFTYVLTAAYFANRLEGAPVFNAGNPSAPLDQGSMKALQRKLQALGHDVGEVDGILGYNTRHRGAEGTGPPRAGARRLADLGSAEPALNRAFFAES